MSDPDTKPSPIHNRLAIAHLMLWTLGSAIILAFYRALILNRAASEYSTYWRVTSLAYSLMAGAQVGSVPLYFWRRWNRAGGFPTAPGHFLLLVEGMSTMLVWSGHGVARFFEPALLQDKVFILAASQLPNCMVTAIAYFVVPSRQRQASQLWQASMLLLGLEHAVAAAYCLVLMTPVSHSYGAMVLFDPLYSFQATCFPVSTSLLLVCASIADPERGHLDFLHWTGVAAICATTVLHLSSGYLIQLLR